MHYANVVNILNRCIRTSAKHDKVHGRTAIRWEKLALWCLIFRHQNYRYLPQKALSLCAVGPKTFQSRISSIIIRTNYIKCTYHISWLASSTSRDPLCYLLETCFSQQLDDRKASWQAEGNKNNTKFKKKRKVWAHCGKTLALWLHTLRVRPLEKLHNNFGYWNTKISKI